MHLIMQHVLAATVLVTSGDAPTDVEPLEALLAQDAAQGFWLSDGYGILLEVGQAGTAIKTYDLSTKACVETTGSETHYSFAALGNLSENATRLSLRTSTDTYDIRFRRLETLPHQCNARASSHTADPLSNFDAFVSYFADHYAFFDVHNPTWLDQAAQFRAQLGEEPGEADIIEPMIGLLSSLQDGHVSIRATVDGDEGEFIAYPGPTLTAVQETFSGEGSPMAAFGKQYLRTDIEGNILGGNGRNAANERIKYGVTSDDVGYMAVMSMGGYASSGDASEVEELAALNEALDEVFALFAQTGVKAVIVDLSVNRGGYDYLGRELAARFADERTLVSSKYAGDADNQTPQPMFVDPSNRAGFDGPVFVLTSDVTVSAAESLTLALRALPNVTHVGARTRGALSDVLEKRLPNNWTVTLSNEVYLDHEGVAWEGKGIKPHHEWQVFDPSNPFAGHFPAVERTIALIDAQVHM